MKNKKNSFKVSFIAPAEICISRPFSHQPPSFLTLHYTGQQLPNLFTLSEQIFILQKSSHYSGYFENLMEILQINKYYPEIPTFKIWSAFSMQESFPLSKFNNVSKGRHNVQLILVPLGIPLLFGCQI